MITGVPLIGVFVGDQEGTLAFYTNKRGLAKVQDEPNGENARWITVSLGVGLMVLGVGLIWGGQTSPGTKERGEP